MISGVVVLKLSVFALLYHCHIHVQVEVHIDFSVNFQLMVQNS